MLLCEVVVTIARSKLKLKGFITFFFEKFFKIKFNEYLFIRSFVDSCLRTDRKSVGMILIRAARSLERGF